MAFERQNVHHLRRRADEIRPGDVFYCEDMWPPTGWKRTRDELCVWVVFGERGHVEIGSLKMGTLQHVIYNPDVTLELVHR